MWNMASVTRVVGCVVSLCIEATGCDMTVKEVIEVLRGFPDDTIVFRRREDGPMLFSRCKDGYEVTTDISEVVSVVFDRSNNQAIL